MWVVVITVLLGLAGAKERVIGIMMVLLVVLRTKPSFVIGYWDGVFVCWEYDFGIFLLIVTRYFQG